MRIFLACIIALFLICQSTNIVEAQTKAEAQKSYLTGKEFFQEGKYNLAKESFRKVGETTDSPYLPYAYFFYAKSAQKQGELVEAKNMALQILNKRPDWNKLDEVYLLLGDLYSELKDYQNGMLYFDKIKDPKLKPIVTQAKQFYFQRIEDMIVLEKILKAYPEDPQLKEIVREKVLRQPFHSKNKSLRDFILKEYPEMKIEALDIKQFRKDDYTVSLLLPFYLNDITDDSELLGRDLVLDLYQGILLANDELYEKGINIKLNVFDSKNDITHVKQMIADGVFRDTDVLIGPIKKNILNVIAPYCDAERITIVNPFSNNGELIEKYQNLLFIQPTLESMASAVVDHIKQGSTESFDVLVLKGQSLKDSLFAEAFVSIFSKDSLDQVKNTYTIEKVNPGDFTKIKQFFFTEIESLDENEEEKTEKVNSSYDGVFVASENKLLIANVVSAAELRGDTLKLYGTENWIYKNLAGQNQMERLGVSLINPHYIDHDDPSVYVFKKLYNEKVGLFPNTQSYTGYDMMHLIGKMLKKYGPYFIFALNQEERIEGQVYSDYYFGSKRTNLNVPIVQMEKGKIIVVNQKH